MLSDKMSGANGSKTVSLTLKDGKKEYLAAAVRVFLQQMTKISDQQNPCGDSKYRQPDHQRQGGKTNGSR